MAFDNAIDPVLERGQKDVDVAPVHACKPMLPVHADEISSRIEAGTLPDRTPFSQY
jgi:hypothetical protein